MFKYADLLTVISLHMQKYVDDTRVCDIFADRTEERFAYSNRSVSYCQFIIINDCSLTYRFSINDSKLHRRILQ